MKSLIIALVVAVLLGAAIYSGVTSGTVVDIGNVLRADVREFVDEQAQTRLPLTHLITMPYDGRIEAIELTEGDAVAKGRLVAQVVPLDP
jgi:multidrug efflux pump subunit AcrA (membrane-fusion protein)